MALFNVVSVTKDARIIMLDIEGTTTSISFVKEELFPYVRQEVESYLKETWEELQTKEDVEALRKQITKDVAAGIPAMRPLPGKDADKNEMITALVASIHCMMDADRKVGSLKGLQGHMWRKAYADESVKGHVYEDVLQALKEWRKEGKDIVIYSSGSVEAQRLLFRHSCFGNLLHFFCRHFDTKIGAKVETQSYKNILKELDCDAKDMVFLTDLPKEAWAAKEAGVKVILSVREGTAPLSAEDIAAFPQITSFSQLFENPSSDSSPEKKIGIKEHCDDTQSPLKKKICTEKE